MNTNSTIWSQLFEYRIIRIIRCNSEKESISLYESAIQFDPTMIPISFSGPVATPPIKDYLQDGEYKDTTPTFKVTL